MLKSGKNNGLRNNSEKIANFIASNDRALKTKKMKPVATDLLDSTVNNIDSGEHVQEALAHNQAVAQHLGGSLNEHLDAISETLNALEGLDQQGAFAAPIAKGRQAVIDKSWEMGREAVQDARDILAQMP